MRALIVGVGRGGRAPWLRAPPRATVSEAKAQPSCEASARLRIWRAAESRDTSGDMAPPRRRSRREAPAPAEEGAETTAPSDVVRDGHWRFASEVFLAEMRNEDERLRRAFNKGWPDAAVAAEKKKKKGVDDEDDGTSSQDDDAPDQGEEGDGVTQEIAQGTDTLIEEFETLQSTLLAQASRTGATSGTGRHLGDCQAHEATLIDDTMVACSRAPASVVTMADSLRTIAECRFGVPRAAAAMRGKAVRRFIEEQLPLMLVLMFCDARGNRSRRRYAIRNLASQLNGARGVGIIPSLLRAGRGAMGKERAARSMRLAIVSLGKDLNSTM